MWQIMYEAEVAGSGPGSGRRITRFIPLNFEGLIDKDDVEINATAALVWYGFCRGRGSDDMVIVGDPELVWREKIDLSITIPETQEDVKIDLSIIEPLEAQEDVLT